jgi:hypothetical protein
VKSESRVAELFEHHRPGWSVQSISDSAGMPALYLQSWITPDETGHPIAPPSRTILIRLAAVLGADFSVVHQAFVSTWSGLKGGYWNHFASGDRVLVFGEPDPVNGRRQVRRGTVVDTAPSDTIRIDFGHAGRGKFSPADQVQVNHVAGTCRCVVAIS